MRIVVLDNKFTIMGFVEFLDENIDKVMSNFERLSRIFKF